MGVFTNLFQDEIKFIEEKYKIKILKIKNIDNGILNSNFYIETKNKKYILRIYEANRIVDEEKQELILLDKIAGFIPVSKAIKNIDNEYISIFTNKKFALFEYINGNSITKIDTHIVREIAMYLGKLHSFSKEISFEEYNRKTRIDFNFYYNEIKKSEINFRFKNELLNLANEINDFDFSTLPSGIIHGDIFPDNVLLDEYNNIKVIFDFNESYYAPFIFDIAIIINFWIKINDFDFFTENNLIRDFLNYYSKYRNELLNLAAEISKYDFSILPSGIIHGDIFPDNVLLDEYNNIKVIFDFNESYCGPFIFDIAIIINFWIKINDFDFFYKSNFIRDFLNYYSKYRKIEKEELKLLDMACKKIALTFIFLRLYKEKIENSYQKAISIEEKSYLDLIKLIDKYEK